MRRWLPAARPAARVAPADRQPHGDRRALVLDRLDHHRTGVPGQDRLDDADPEAGAGDLAVTALEPRKNRRPTPELVRGDADPGSVTRPPRLPLAAASSSGDSRASPAGGSITRWTLTLSTARGSGWRRPAPTAARSAKSASTQTSWRVGVAGGRRPPHARRRARVCISVRRVLEPRPRERQQVARRAGVSRLEVAVWARTPPGSAADPLPRPAPATDSGPGCPDQACALEARAAATADRVAITMATTAAIQARWLSSRASRSATAACRRSCRGDPELLEVGAAGLEERRVVGHLAGTRVQPRVGVVDHQASIAASGPRSRAEAGYASRKSRGGWWRAARPTP